MTRYISRSRGKDTNVSISDSDFVASGGEKSVYRKGQVAYCVYHNRRHVTPEAKIRELAKVSHDGFITPTGLLLDAKGSRVGEVLPFIENANVLVELFSNGFRKKNGVTHQTDLAVLSQMFDITCAAHSAGVILVDHNDMNWLVGKGGKGPVSLIDTSSAKTPSFPAMAIKPAIRDPEAADWTEESDYYSLAVLTAWLWCGIHPFTVLVSGFSGDMLEKQKLGLSIFSSKAELNASVRPHSSMPKKLKEWVVAHLTSKERPFPPSISGESVKEAAATHTVTQSGSVTWEAIHGENPWTDPSCTYDFMSASTIFVDGSKVTVNGVPGCVGFAKNEMSVHDGSVLLIQSGSMFEVVPRVVSGALRFSNREVARLADMPHATFIGDGCVVQDLIGKKVIHTTDRQYVQSMPGCKVVSAASHSGVVMMTVIDGSGTFRATILPGNRLHKEPLPVAEPPNFCVLKKGVVVENRGGELVAYHSDAPSKRKTGSIPVDMRLLTDGVRVLGELNGKAYQIKLK